MKRLANVLMYLSAFLPMLTVMWLKEFVSLILQLISKRQTCKQLNWFFLFNPYLGVSLVMICIVYVGFSCLLSNNKEISTKLIKVHKTKNQVAEYYLGYYSLFVLTLIGFSLVNITDIVELCFLMIILGIVYIKNGLYYMNPTVNILRSFIYEVEYLENDKTTSKIVIAKERIYDGETISIYQSKYDFSLMEKKVK
ncbi:MAG: hypothetical protein LBK61_05520 [Spirochaetaceae bacterium]|nr:hypothetical protein [Spirochaetaceae bacterium]